jgi:predicted metalloprotease with PDZ domain
MNLKKIVYITSIFFLIAGCMYDNTSMVDIEYTVQPKLKESKAALKVTFDHTSDHKGLIKLRYENDSWGDSEIFNCITGFDVVPKPNTIEFLKDSSQIIISATPNIEHSISYEITQDYHGPPLNKKRYRPMMDSSYFHILGMRLFVVPEGIFPSDSSQAKIRINYKDQGNEGLFHSSFGKKTVQNLEVTREDLYASFFIGGDFRRYSFSLEKDSVYFLTRGNWKSFDDHEILEILKQTIRSQNEFWNDPRDGNFSVSLVPTYESWYSVGGSGFSSSFISFASNNDKVSLNHMRWLYNHELLHKWIGRTIINENEVEQYWFSEGFTDYYSYKLQLKFDHLNIAEYIDIINKEMIIPYYEDPVKNTPNAELTFQEYWGNYSKYQKLPYRRGFIYAFYIDNQIKKESNYSNSLDNVMHELFTLALKDKNMRFNKSMFLKILSNYLSHANINSDFERFIIKGESIDFGDEVPKGIFIDYQNSIPILGIDPENGTELRRKLKI